MRFQEFSESAVPGSIVDLTKNWGNFERLLGKVQAVMPNGKLKIEIVVAEPRANKQGAVVVGDTVTLAPHYIKRSAVISPPGVNNEKLN